MAFKKRFQPQLQNFWMSYILIFAEITRLISFFAKIEVLYTFLSNKPLHAPIIDPQILELS